jgi:hypothetical protein
MLLLLLLLCGAVVCLLVCVAQQAVELADQWLQTICTAQHGMVCHRMAWYFTALRVVMR